MKNLSIILCLCVSSLAFAQEDMFASEGSGTFQSNPASFGNQEIWSVNTFGQIRFKEYHGAQGSFNVNAGGLVPLTKGTKHQLIIGGTYSYGQNYFVINQTSRLSLGYRLKWNKNTSVSIAVGPGISDFRYNPCKQIVCVVNGGDGYPIKGNQRRKFDLSIGAMFNWKSLYTGASVTHLNRPAVGVGQLELAPTYYLQAGYKIPLKGHSIFPVAQLQHVEGFTRYQFMANYVFKNNLFSTGLGYQSGGTLLLCASLELKGIRLGYNYNTIPSRFGRNSIGTHELRLSYIVKSKKAYLWHVNEG